ncbi:hypothetical protein MOB40_04275 [Bacillus inaquosorum]|uniref:hypothetical protein n=1 Tax=Bacillus inaquosorum TaxID=483913 RepID=UPI000516385D|nr:hypothetical protein [Bacillus inaquosorum]MCY7904142.1 hypothetical protein [Bacillus inaquosorum]MCY7931453.1 hypothetical protein [Bacillus inaquosorum]MCY8770143.1 hypothetical protein [Bacillus inaquosorum]MCY9049072.1 hypothetical protein [Bacillus inaquosorum]
MSLTMDEYLNHVQSSITRYLEDIYAIEQKQIKINSGATQTFKEYREYLSEKSSLSSMKPLHINLLSIIDINSHCFIFSRRYLNLQLISYRIDVMDMPSYFMSKSIVPIVSFTAWLYSVA